MLKGKLKGQTRLETAENCSMAGVVIGVVMLSVGIISTTIQTQGITAVTAMLGAIVSFASTVALIFVWAIKEFKGS